MVTRHAYVHEAEIDLGTDVDPRAVGAAVTVALCGHWEHEGPCLWPHNNDIAEGHPPTPPRVQIGDSATPTHLYRTLFVCEPSEEPTVRAKIRAALHTSPEWRLIVERERAVAPQEQALANDLLRVPRRV